MGLLERAGLEKGRPNRPSPSPKPAPGAKPTAVNGLPAAGAGSEEPRPGGARGEAPKPVKKPDSDESIALKWLESSEDEN
jgi:hypothetical protein